MSRIDQAGERLLRASDLATVLDAACDAFEDMLSVIRACEDPGDEMFTVMVMAAGSAADGRDAILFAPSLPPRRLHPPAAGEEQGPAGSTADTVDALARLSGMLAARLDDAACAAPDPGDRAACLGGARWARDVHTLLVGGGP
jgi:hypothetical protein